MSPKERQRLNVNSLLAYHAGQENLFEKREQAILSIFRERGSCTAREVMVALEFTDMNSVRPRICELVKEGVLAHLRDERDPETGKRVGVFFLALDPRLAQATFDFKPVVDAAIEAIR